MRYLTVAFGVGGAIMLGAAQFTDRPLLWVFNSVMCFLVAMFMEYGE